MSILQLPIGVALTLAGLGGVLVAIAFTRGAHWIWGPQASEELADVTSFSLRAIGAVYALILALSFNAVMAEHTELEEAIDEEAILLVQIAEDSIEEMDAASGRAAAEDIKIYVAAVVD